MGYLGIPGSPTAMDRVVWYAHVESQLVPKAEARSRSRRKKAAAKKIGGPRGWVRQRPKKDQGQIYLLDVFKWCF
jgi:hypothetical protein